MLPGNTTGRASLDEVNSPTWSELELRGRHRVASLDIPRCFPHEPGIYLWFREAEPVYLGVAAVSLRRRLGTHLRPTPGSVRGTTLKRTVAELLGIATRAEARERRLTQDEVDRIVAWMHQCELTWVVLPGDGQARAAEKALLAEFRPPLNRSG